MRTTRLSSREEFDLSPWNKLKESWASIRSAMNAQKSYRSNNNPLNTSFHSVHSTQSASINPCSNRYHSSHLNWRTERDILSESIPLVSTERTSRDDINKKWAEWISYSDSLKEELMRVNNSNNELISLYETINDKAVDIQKERESNDIDSEHLEKRKQELIFANSEWERNFKEMALKWKYEDSWLDQELKGDDTDSSEEKKKWWEMNNSLKEAITKYEEVIKQMKGKCEELSSKKTNETDPEFIEEQMKIIKTTSDKMDDYLNKLVLENEAWQEDIKSKSEMWVRNANVNANANETEREEVNEEMEKDMKQIKLILGDSDMNLGKMKVIIQEKDKEIKDLQMKCKELSTNTKGKTVNQSEVHVKKNGISENEWKLKIAAAKQEGQKRMKVLQELNQITESLVESREKQKLAYEEEIKRLKNKWESIPNPSPMKVSSGELEKLLKENEEIKAHRQWIVQKVEKLPELEKKFKEISNMNLQLIEENTSIKQLLEQYEEVQEQAQKQGQSIAAFTELNMENEEDKEDYNSKYRIYSIINHELTSYNPSTKSFEIVKNVKGFDKFLSNNYNSKGSAFLNTWEGLFILTGVDYNVVFYYSKGSNSISEFIRLKVNHQFGSMILDEVNNSLFVISGAFTAKLEKMNFMNKTLSTLPSLSSNRAHSAHCVVNQTLYSFFGFNYDSNDYLNTIECLDLIKEDEWKIMRIKSGNTSLNYRNHWAMIYNKDNILIIGGDKDNVVNKGGVVINLQNGSISNTDILMKEDCRFENSKGYNLIISDENAGSDAEEDIKTYSVAIDDNGNVHYVDDKWNYAVVRYAKENEGVNDEEEDEDI